MSNNASPQGSSHSSPSTPRRVFARTKNSPSFSKEKERERERDKDDCDDSSSNHSDHYKYQTIQSFRPEEVKELLSQHFLDPAVNGRTSAPTEDGIRRFSLVRTNFKQRRAFRNSRDAATLRGMVEDGEGTRSENGIPDDKSEDSSHTASDSHTEAGRLRAQLMLERSVHQAELAKLRAQLRAFEAHLETSVARMGSLLEMIDAREKAVQDLLAKNSLSDEFEKEREKEKDNEKGGK